MKFGPRERSLLGIFVRVGHAGRTPATHGREALFASAPEADPALLPCNPMGYWSLKGLPFLGSNRTASPCIIACRRTAGSGLLRQEVIAVIHDVDDESTYPPGVSAARFKWTRAWSDHCGAQTQATPGERPAARRH